MNFEIVIPSNRPLLSLEAQLCVQSFNHRIFNGTNYPSFSKLINDCILTSIYETVIICNDKARPQNHDIIKIINMLNAGWGLVALYRFGFFGFKKDLIRKIGFFDERYLGGGYEDCDFVRRLKEANIGYYESEEIDYFQIPTSWKYEINNISFTHFHQKWKHENNIITRQMAEEDYGYNIGPFNHIKFIEFEKSVLIPLPNNLHFKNMVMQTNFL